MDTWAELDICEIHDELGECDESCMTDFSDYEDFLDEEDEMWLPYQNGQMI
jgi:hypothetical protein